LSRLKVTYVATSWKFNHKPDCIWGIQGAICLRKRDFKHKIYVVLFWLLGASTRTPTGAPPLDPDWDFCRPQDPGKGDSEQTKTRGYGLGLVCIRWPRDTFLGGQESPYSDTRPQTFLNCPPNLWLLVLWHALLSPSGTRSCQHSVQPCLTLGPY